MTAEPTGMPVAERGKRPRHRQSMIIAAAADLFAERGFSNVSMSDIAEVVKVQPSALYRHFSGKQDLLRATIAQGVAIQTAAVGSDDPDRTLEQTISDLVESALETRSLSSLWTTEVRLLEVEHSSELRRQIRALPETLAARLSRSRPDLRQDQAALLSYAFLDTLASISYVDEGLGPKQMTATLEGVGRRVLTADGVFSDGGKASIGALEVDEHSTRRDHLASAAARLFRRRGFAAVTLEDIGGEVGMAGASIYGHFASKQELLDELLVRSVEWERYAVAQSLRDGGSSYVVDALRGYARFVTDAPDLALVRLTEARHGSEAVARRSTLAERDDVTRWATALQTNRPGLDLAQCRVEVRAARMAALDMLTTSTMRRIGVDLETVTQLCAVIMGLPDEVRDA